jgi:prepilin-type N-terminal cleavage/methylation domain-containing protein/prepilin-type processing-associated H-X9-DG protein
MRETTHVRRFCGDGFTLIELLVVISIIAVMMSISLPALTNAQREGEAIHCLANERQLTLAWMQYAGECEDRLCTIDSFTSALKPYAPMDEVFVCKAVQDGSVTRSYGISNAMGGMYRDGVTPYEKLHKITFPSDKMVFVDVVAGSRPCFWPLLRDEEVWKWRPWSWPPANNLQTMTARHNHGCNMSFADGHCEYYRWRDRRTLELIAGAIADPREASSGNVDLDHMVEIMTR